nr:hypothetical protein [Tanacetum cinerariifolium]
MAAPVIPILSDSSEESVGSHVSRVILFGAIPAIIHVILGVPAEVPIIPVDPLVTPEVGVVSVTSPTGVLDLVDYSSSDSDPSKDSLLPATKLPLVTPFLCSDDSEADSESEPAEQRPERHKSLVVHYVMVSRWRYRVTSRPSSLLGSSSHDTLAPSSEFPVAPVVAPPEICRRPAILIRPGEAIPFGRTYPPILIGRVNFTSDSSTSGSSPISSSDTFSSSPLDSFETFSRWRSAPLSTPYPPTTSESSPNLSSERSLDSSSLSAGPSRKRCKSPTTSVPSSTLVLSLISPTHADILPPCKREEHMQIGIADTEAVAYLGIGDGVDTGDGIGIEVENAASDIREDEEEFEAEVSAGGTMEIVVDPLITSGIFESNRGDVPDLKGTLYDIVHYMLELMASRERAGLNDRIRRFGQENLRVRDLLCIARDRVDSLRHHMTLSQEEFLQICRDRDDARRRLRRLESLVEKRLGFRP